MASEIKDRRLSHRCTKDVGMHCTVFLGSAHRLVTIRNYSTHGIYFESYGIIQPGTIVVLRTTGANDFLDVDAAARAPLFSIAKSDPEVCTRFRSHLLARVQRCVKIDGHDENERYGIGAEIQMLTD